MNELDGHSVTCIAESEDSIWFGTTSEGLFLHKKENDALVNFALDKYNSESLRSNYVRNIFIDENNIVWIGTFTGGVNIYDPNKYRFNHYKCLPSSERSILSDTVRCFIEDSDGNLLVGAEGGGVTKYFRSSDKVQHYVSEKNNPNTINSNMIRDMYKDNTGKLWVFTFSGISYYDEDKDCFRRYTLPCKVDVPIENHELRFIYEDSSKRVWIGSDQGLILYNTEDGSYEYYHSNADSKRMIASNKSRFIFELRSGDILLVTLSGNSIINPDKDKLINYRRVVSGDKTCYHSFIYCVHETDRYIWLGTHEGLFKKVKSTGDYRRFTTKDGLPNDVIYGILQDEDDNLWLSTNKGLSRYSIHTDKFSNFDVSDGLQSVEFNNASYYKAQDGSLFFGGVNGYNKFYPRDIVDDKEPVKLIFNKFYIANKVVDRSYQKYLNNQLVVPYFSQQFGFEFLAIEYSHPEKIVYEYILEGYDKRHKRTKTNTVFYDQVPPGEYVFRVRSTNRDGIWGDNEISIKVRIEKPLWQQSLKPQGDFSINEILEKYLNENFEDLEDAFSQELLTYMKDLTDSAYQDALTGVFNRAGYMKYFSLYSSSEFLPLGLFIIDVDNLKLINDYLGHQRGDEALKLVNRILKNCIFDMEAQIARMGGDEFAILVPNCNKEKIELIDLRLSNLRKEYGDEGSQEYVSFSYGYACSNKCEIEELYPVADQEMYEFKSMRAIETRQRTMAYVLRNRE